MYSKPGRKCSSSVFRQTMEGWDVEEMRASGSFGMSCSTAPPMCGASPTPLSPASSQLVSQQLASPPTDQPQPASNSARQQWRR